MSDTVDVIVVGAGSAGCVMANRLSADGAHAVCLLEAGPRDTYPWIHIPIGYGKTMFHKVVNWGYYTDPDPNMLGRRIYWPRGRQIDRASGCRRTDEGRVLLGSAQVQVVSSTSANGDPYAGLIQIFHLEERGAVLDQISAFDDHVWFAKGDLDLAHRFDGEERDIPLLVRQGFEHLAGGIISDELHGDAQLLAECQGKADGHAMRLSCVGIALCQNRIAKIDGGSEHAVRCEILKDVCSRGEHGCSPEKLL